MRKVSKEWYGPYELDYYMRDILQRFTQAIYNEWRDGTPIPKKNNTWHWESKEGRFWHKLFHDYRSGSVSYDLTLFDSESEKPPVDLSKLTTRFSKEV